MVYSFELIKHANIHYRQSISVLAQCELFAMLSSFGITCEIRHEKMGGSEFLTFECRELNVQELSRMSVHSAVVFMAEKKDGLLRPLPVVSASYLPDDLPEILKYKGKTSVTFTRMMINTAAALSSFQEKDYPLAFFDPVCGRGTGCFCAAAYGMNAVGLDLNRNYIKEAVDYFSRYLQHYKLKYERTVRSETVSGQAIPITSFSYADTREHFHSGNIRTLSLSCADTLQSPALFRKKQAHIIAADLPYGIQHAPRSGGGIRSFQHFLLSVLPLWKKTLRPGGVIALSFNTLTLPSDDVREALVCTGYRLPEHNLFRQLRHEVEHAVVRDVIFAFNSQEESVI